MTIAAEDMVVARPGPNDVVAVTPVDVVIPFARIDVVRAKGAKQIVISCRSEDRRRADDGKMSGLRD